MTECAKCFHEETNHKNMDGTDKCICSGSITCMCDTFAAPVLTDFAHQIEKNKSKIKTIYDRCYYILMKIPQTRNAGEKTFAKIYNEIWNGVRIRKESSNVNTQVWQRADSADSINREKRRIKEKFPECKTYDPEILRKQNILYQTYMELATEN